MRSLLIAILIFMCVSCTTTKYVDRPVPVETVRTEYVNQLYRDSVFVHDSIDRFIKGDSVFIYKTKDIYKYKYLTDTVIKCDSIPVPYKVETIKEIKTNEIKWYQSFLMGMGTLLSIAAILFLAIKLIKKKL